MIPSRAIARDVGHFLTLWWKHATCGLQQLHAGEGGVNVAEDLLAVLSFHGHSDAGRQVGDDHVGGGGVARRTGGDGDQCYVVVPHDAGL